MDDYYETIYRPAIEGAGLEPHRADDLYRPSTIVNDIWAYTKRAKLLLADLTGKNQNVFYELGLAHGIGKPAILIAESMDDIPFDLRALRVIVFDKNDQRWGELLQDKVQNAIQEVLKSPQEAVLPAFLHVRDTAAAVSVTPREKEIIEIKQELELLRQELRHGGELSRESPRINASDALERIESYVSAGAPSSFILKRLVALGAPEDWVRRTIKRSKERSNILKEAKDQFKGDSAIEDEQDAATK